jgi:outer membrane protein OmpA-like peptidoglycan-associated protein
MAGELIVFGNFKGNFFTNQIIALNNNEAIPNDDNHLVQVYKGDMTDVNFEENYQPSKYKKLASFLLTNVPNVSIPNKTLDASQSHNIHNFTQLILIEPRVTKNYVVNGKTYGVIESLGYGITENVSLPKKEKPKEEEKAPPPSVDEGYTGQDENSDKDDPKDSDSHKVGDGCFNFVNGCFSNFWRILFYFLLFLLLLGLFDWYNNRLDYCGLNEEAVRTLNKEKLILDSTKLAYDENLKEALASISVIYFYKNTTEFHLNSIGNNSPIERLFRLMKVYEDKNFLIEGHHSGHFLEPEPNLDILRAQKLKEKLVSMGIEGSRIQTIGKANIEMLDNSGKVSTFFISVGKEKEYNRNMRAQVNYANKP